ncbi:probable low-specificity L-threonine aldolase 1 [Hibiscus syriacus]|uniref:probable low-specificity L-threonine aldolase 1 n=1 Tax=Hibiscus syriacus TaxID=106335 RepID=UPI0019227400|nr:probable low-specificity L-threonine aldolase 1 [Hibiscus syriacus]
MGITVAGMDFLSDRATMMREALQKSQTIMGKEAGLFVSSSTMGNLISVLVHYDISGSEVILGDNSHLNIYENSGISTIRGVHPRPVKNNHDGTIDINSIKATIRDRREAIVYPTTRLVCLENSHANTRDRGLFVEYIDKVGELTKKHDLRLHVDGARIFNDLCGFYLGITKTRFVSSLEKMRTILIEESEKGIEVNGRQILEKVLNSKYGYIRGLGYEAKPSSSKKLELKSALDAESFDSSSGDASKHLPTSDIYLFSLGESIGNKPYGSLVARKSKHDSLQPAKSKGNEAHISKGSSKLKDISSRIAKGAEWELKVVGEQLRI